MSRILLADDSPHAQRMGERILREEGYEVVTVTDGATALMRLADVDPDLVFADVSLPGRTGYDICREVKSQGRHRHVRVILTAGLLEHFDEAQAVAVRCDAVLKKPFEASVVLSTVKPLMEAAEADRVSLPHEPSPEAAPDLVVPVRVVSERPAQPAAASAIRPAPSRVTSFPVLQPLPHTAPQPALQPVPVPSAAAASSQWPPTEIDRERVRAAVILALDAALPAMIDEITEKVLVALGH